MKTIALYEAMIPNDETQRLRLPDGDELLVRVAEIKPPEGYDGDPLDLAQDETRTGEEFINTIDICDENE